MAKGTINTETAKQLIRDYANLLIAAQELCESLDPMLAPCETLNKLKINIELGKTRYGKS